MLVQSIRDLGEPGPVLGLLQDFQRGEIFDAVWWRIPQRLEQPRGHQHRHIMRLAVDHRRHLFGNGNGS